MPIDGVPVADWKLADVTPEVLGKWRDSRLKRTEAKNFEDKVLGSSVNRDLNLLSHVFSSAVKEWKWIAKSPTTDVRRPADPPSRDRLYSEDEVERLCAALGIDVDQAEPVKTATHSASASPSCSRSRQRCVLVKSAACGPSTSLVGWLRCWRRRTARSEMYRCRRAPPRC